MEHCETCRWWSDRTCAPWLGKHHVCLYVSGPKFDIEHMAAVTDKMCLFATLPTFGCAEWAAREAGAAEEA